MRRSGKPTEWMPFHIDAFKAKTLHCSFMERWAYMALLTCYWRNQAPLPDDEKRLIRMAELSPDEWESVRDIVLEFFVKKDGKLHQSRMDEEIQKAQWIIEKRRAAGRKGGTASGKARSKYNEPDEGESSKRKANASSIAKQTPSKDEASASANVQQTSSKGTSKTNTCGYRQETVGESPCSSDSRPVKPLVIPVKEPEMEDLVAGVELTEWRKIKAREAANSPGDPLRVKGVS